MAKNPQLRMRFWHPPAFVAAVVSVAVLGMPGVSAARPNNRTPSAADWKAPSLLPSMATLNDVLEQHSRRGGSGSGGGGRAVPRGGGSVGSGGSRSGDATSGGGRADSGGSRAGVRPRTQADGAGSGNTGGDSPGTPTYSRPREDRPATGTAVERRGDQGGTVIVGGGGYYGGFYPWGWGGLGLGGYYGYYDPWGWYDPYPPVVGYGYRDDGALKLKVKPRQAEVFVDGYFAGAVDDYDGIFQRLRLEPGPHRIEVMLDGYEPLTFDVRIEPDRTVTYRGELVKRDTDPEDTAN